MDGGIHPEKDGPVPPMPSGATSAPEGRLMTALTALNEHIKLELCSGNPACPRTPRGGGCVESGTKPTPSLGQVGNIPCEE